ncbi:hypothetical protein ACWFMI_10765 [Nocardiopsis terrae]
MVLENKVYVEGDDWSGVGLSLIRFGSSFSMGLNYLLALSLAGVAFYGIVPTISYFLISLAFLVLFVRVQLLLASLLDLSVLLFFWRSGGRLVFLDIYWRGVLLYWVIGAFLLSVLYGNGVLDVLAGRA